MAVRKALRSDRVALARMRALLWPEGSFEEHLDEVDDALASGMSGTLPMALLVAEDEGAALGFIEVGLRSHADGCDVSQPVGFIEGWFVEERVRAKGIGRELMRAAEGWARGHGCLEMASDTWIDSEGSQRAHSALGYEIVDRCVHYRKAL